MIVYGMEGNYGHIQFKIAYLNPKQLEVFETIHQKTYVSCQNISETMKWPFGKVWKYMRQLKKIGIVEVGGWEPRKYGKGVDLWTFSKDDWRIIRLEKVEE